MSLADKAKNKTEEATGTAKGKLGQTTGDEDLGARGRAEQTDATIKQAGEHVKDAGRDTKNAAKDAAGM